ncbi:hypothetical protein GMLC_16430 [Geomonas limicola]|uniref:Uncharacterized protein n=1 Tax=Geomonas limicola TaxID=2740186 RepID=A0A6V8N7Z6_9BACT|nr:hypothetical protein GMLC_16430 [Geomonas limicola]
MQSAGTTEGFSHLPVTAENAAQQRGSSGMENAPATWPESPPPASGTAGSAPHSVPYQAPAALAPGGLVFPDINGSRKKKGPSLTATGLSQEITGVQLRDTFT